MRRNLGSACFRLISKKKRKKERKKERMRERERKGERERERKKTDTEIDLIPLEVDLRDRKSMTYNTEEYLTKCEHELLNCTKLYALTKNYNYLKGEYSNVNKDMSNEKIFSCKRSLAAEVARMQKYSCVKILREKGIANNSLGADRVCKETEGKHQCTSITPYGAYLAKRFHH